MDAHADDNGEGSWGADSPPRLLLVLLVSVLARGLFLLCVPADAVSIDIRMWLRVAERLAAGANPYSVTTGLNWPPLWLQILFGLDWLSQAASTPLYRMIQIFLIGTEGLLIVATYHLLIRLRITQRPGTVLLWGIALNPICILQVCQHGNFDVLVGLWVVLTILMLLRFHASRAEIDWLYACLFLGLGILTKTTPVVLIPVLLIGTSGLSLRYCLLGMVLIFAPAALGISVLFSLDPASIWHKVLLYRSEPRVFGLTGMLSIWGCQNLLAFYSRAFPWVFLGLLAATSFRTRRRESVGPGRALALASLLLMIIPAFGPGYGVQYIYWFLPLLLVTAVAQSGSIRWAVGIFLAVAAATYIFEYALYPDLGAFLTKALASDSLYRAGLLLRAPEYRSLLRLPLFAAYTGTILILWRVSMLGRNPTRPGPAMTP